MILAAGRGERLRPLTDTCPKPLLEVGGQPLIAHVLDRLQAADVQRCVINLSWLGEQLRERLQREWRWDMTCAFSHEHEQRLETGGGIFNVLDQLGPQPIIVGNADVYCDFDLTRLQRLAAQWPTGRLAHLVLVDNPEHHPQGDFGLNAAGLAVDTATDTPAGELARLTFSGISLLHPALFDGQQPGRFALAPLLRQAMAAGQVSAEHHRGCWTDVGTPERLAQIRQRLS